MAFTISNNSPAAGHISWSGLHIQFAGQTFAITDGSTDKVYAWWTPLYPNNLVVSDTFPTLTANDCLVLLNKSGVAVVVPTATVLDGDLIVPGTVLANALAANSVTADKIAAGAVTAGALAANSVTASAIAADAIGADKIAANAILTEMIVSGAVTTDKLAAASVIANKIAAGAVETAKLAAGAITAEKIAAGTITADKIDVDNLFASSAFLRKLQVSAAPRVDTLPSSPAVGQSVIYAGVTPNEYLQWTGKGINPTQRRYAASKTGASVSFDDLSDDHTLGVTVRTVAIQAGSGTPSPSNIRPIGGKTSVKILRRGKNLADPTISGATSNGVTVSYDPANQTITLNGTCTTNNTNLFFAVAPEQINAAHILSMYYVSGTAARVGENSLWMAEASYANAFGVPAFPDAGRSSSSVVNAARNYVYFALRLDAGSVFTNYKFKLQLEFGSAPSDWEPYVAQAYTLIPDAPTYGLSEAQDHIGTDGLVAHYTMLLTLTGNEAFNDGSDLGSVVRVGLPGIIAGTPGDTPSICSHFQHLYSYASDTVHYYVTGDTLILYIPKSLLSSYDLAGAKAWIKAQNETAHTPIQVLYQRANPVYAAVAPVAITGMDGINTVTSDGASVTVSYTGSGWAAAGAVQRVAIEAVEITPELGIKVSQILTDGTNTKNVYTQIFHGGLQIYDADTGALIGGLFMQNGEVYLFASALADPRVSSSFNTTVFTQAVTEYTQTGASYAATAFGMAFRQAAEEIAKIFITRENSPAEGFGLTKFRIESPRPIKIKSTGTDDAGQPVYTLFSQDQYTATMGYHSGTYVDGTPKIYLKVDGYNNKIYSSMSITNLSDARFKQNIGDIDPNVVKGILTSIIPRRYEYLGMDGVMYFGFIAQELYPILEKLGITNWAGYSGENPDRLGIDYEQFIALLVMAWQQHQHDVEMLGETAADQAAEIQALKADRDAHKQRLDDLERRLTALKQPEAAPEEEPTPPGETELPTPEEVPPPPEEEPLPPEEEPPPPEETEPSTPEIAEPSPPEGTE